LFSALPSPTVHRALTLKWRRDEAWRPAEAFLHPENAKRFGIEYDTLLLPGDSRKFDATMDALKAIGSKQRSK
jgi:hypothetical protein